MDGGDLFEELLDLDGEARAAVEGVELAVNELEKHPELYGPLGSTPFHRPMYWGYVLGETDATSIEDYLDRHQISGDPAGAQRFYAGLISTEPNRGVSGIMNQFQPRVEQLSVSVLEFAVACPAPAVGPEEELIGVVISVDKANGFGKHGFIQEDGKPRLHVEYHRWQNGKLQVVWDKRAPGFVPNPFSPYLLGGVVPVSTANVVPQVEHRVDIVQTPVNGDGWIAYNGFFLGYYPGSLFTQLNQGACFSGWYTEVVDQTSDPKWVKTQVGTEKLPNNAGPLEAASVRQPKYRDLSWAPCHAMQCLLGDPPQQRPLPGRRPPGTYAMADP